MPGTRAASTRHGSSAAGFSDSLTPSSRGRSAITGSGSRSACASSVSSRQPTSADRFCRSVMRNGRTSPRCSSMWACCASQSPLAEGSGTAQARHRHGPAAKVYYRPADDRSREEGTVASEPEDVLLIGAGASGGVVGLRLAEAGFKVVCLEQGDWLDRANYPGNKLDWELKARKDWATSPNIRGLAADYPIVEDDSPVSPLMYNAVGGSTIIFAGAWPRALPSDFRVRSLDGIADDWP